MSIKITSFVWQTLTQYREEKLLVLLALADFADDDGVCWPSIPRIASKARITERGTRKIIHRLTYDKTISLLSAGGGRGNTAKYQINTEQRNPVSQTPIHVNSVSRSTQTLNVEAINPERRDTAIRKESSLNRHKEPSGRGTRISPDFKVTEEHRRWASDRSLPSPDSLVEEFIDYWKAVPGSRGLKLDWEATFHNSIKRAAERNGRNGNGKRESSFGRISKMLAKVDGELAAERGSGGNKDRRT